MRILAFAFISLLTVSLVAQDFPSNEKEYEKQYFSNIKKSRINGVYIPKDLDDAFKELKALSPPESLVKFKNAPEDLVAKKLHGGLGLWMIVNWNFYDGSRFSHWMKTKGISHPDDMAEFVIKSFHRHLNGLDLQVKERSIAYAEKRKKMQQAKLKSKFAVKSATPADDPDKG